MIPTPLSKLALVAAVTAVLAGCGSAGLLSTATSGLEARARGGAQADNGASGAHHPGGPGGFGGGKGGMRGPEGPGGPGGPGFGGPGFDLKSLNLTADQETQLKALMAADKPEAKPSHDANAADPFKAVQDAILATTVDDAALRAALKAQEDGLAAHQPPNPGTKLAAIRAILTDDQRATIVKQLQDAQTKRADFEKNRPSPKPRPSDAAAPADKQADKLALTDAQKALLDAFKAKLKPTQGDAPADPSAGMIAFWQTGDAAGLAAPARPAFPVDEFVAAVEALSLDQRKALFSHGIAFGGPEGDRMGGRGEGGRMGGRGEEGRKGGFPGGKGEGGGKPGFAGKKAGGPQGAGGWGGRGHGPQGDKPASAPAQ